MDNQYEYKPQRIRITTYEDSPLALENLSAFLYDLVLIHDRLFLLLSTDYKGRIPSGLAFYRRNGRPIKKSDKLQISLITKESPLLIELIVSELSSVFYEVPIEPEWSAMTDSRDLYCPRLDVAVGPFAIGNNHLERTYDNMMNNARTLINSMLAFHNTNVEKLSWEIPHTSWDNLFYTNSNARCLLAIEIENEVSRKHLIGGAVNAAALGRIGIVVGWNEEKLNALIKLRRYLNYLTSVGKNSFNTHNLIILDPTQLIDSITAFFHVT